MATHARLMALATLGAASLLLAGCTPSTPGGSSGGEEEVTYTVWYADVIDANPIASAIAQGMNSVLKENGVTLTRTFAVDPSTGTIDLAVQSQGITRAIAADADAIAYFVLDPTAAEPQVTQALDGGIPVFAAFGTPAFDVSAYLSIDDKAAGYAAAEYLANQLPEGSEVAIIGGPATPNVLATEAGALEAFEDAGLTVVGDIDQQRNLSDNAEGGSDVMQGILQQFPEIDGVFAYNDDSALGAIAAAKQASASVQFTSRNGTADGVAAVKSGDLLATCDLQPIQLGQALGEAIVAQLTGKKAFKNEAIQPPPASECLITADNADSWKPYDEQVEYTDIAIG